MRFWTICFTFALTVLLAESSKLSSTKVQEKVRYDGYNVYKLKISEKSQLSALKFVEKHAEKFSIWKEYDERSKEIHIMVHPELQQFFKLLNQMNGVQMDVMIDDIQKLIDDEQIPSKIQSLTDDDEYNWTRYHTLDEVYQWLDKILQEHPDVTSEINIGKSYEGRTIRGIKISFKANNPGLFIESNIHAREWITVETTTWLINELLKSTDPAVRELAESVDWYIVPVLNVDGFVYSHEKDRLWRKTRQPHPQSECIGADPNRNYDVEWMANGGASQDPCSYNFAGLQPFSEPEIKAIADYVASIKNKLNIMLAFHSYSQLLLSPYGHTTEERPPNHDDLMAVGEAYAAAVMSLPYKTFYEVGPTAEVLYVASGGMNDWAYTKMGIELSYTIEFRDQGRFGFVLPPIHIIPNCEETLAGLIEFVKKAKALGYLTLKS